MTTSASPLSYTAVLRKMMRMLAPQHWLLGLVIAIGIVHQSLMIGGNALGAYLVGAAFGGAGTDTILAWLWVLIGIVVLRAGAFYLEMYWAHDLAYRALAYIRIKMYWALERLDLGQLLDRRSGDVSAIVMADVNIIEFFYAHTLGAFISAVFVVCLTLVALAFIHPFLLFAVLPAVILSFTVPAWLSRRAAREGMQLRGETGAANAELVDNVQGLREILSFGQAANRLKRMLWREGQVAAANAAYAHRSGMEAAVTDALTALGIVSVLIVGGVLVGSGEIALSLFPVAVVVATYIFKPISDVATIGQSFGTIHAAANRVFAILDAAPRIADSPTASAPAAIESAVAFNGVTFRYGPALPPAVDGVSFTIQPGETVALVGASGAG